MSLIFLPDQFSESHPLWEAINIGKEKEIAKLLKPLEIKYSKFIGEVDNFYKLKGLEINSSNFLIKGSSGNLVIKLINQNQSSSFESQLDVYDHIKNLGLPAPCVVGRVLDDSSLCVPHIAMKHLQGHYFSGSKNDMELTASAIKKFHDGFSNYEKSNLPKLEILQAQSSKILNDFIGSKEEWRLKFGAELDLILRKNIDLILEVEKRCSANLDNLLEIEQSIFHVDLHPHNIIVSTDSAKIIDIHSLGVSRWPTALGFGFFKLVRQAFVNQGLEGLEYSEIVAFFEEISGDIDTGENKWELLFSGALTDVLRRLLIIFKGNLKGKVSPWNQVMKIQIDALSEIDFLASKFRKNRYQEL